MYIVKTNFTQSLKKSLSPVGLIRRVNPSTNGIGIRWSTRGEFVSSCDKPRNFRELKALLNQTLKQSSQSNA